MLMPLESVIFLPFFLLLMAMGVLYVKAISQYWLAIFFISFVFAWFYNIVTLHAAWPLIALILCCQVIENSKRYASLQRIRPLIWVIFIVLAILLATHQFSSFLNPLLLSNAEISAAAMPYSLYLNYDKAALGLIILAAVSPLSQQVGMPQKSELLIVFCGVVVIIIFVSLLAVIMGYVSFDPKWNSIFLIWVPVNLFITCVAEEVFFRGMIQRHLSQRLSLLAHGEWVALFIVSILFAVAHIAGGWHYVVLAGLAGIGYGWVYMRTKRIEFSIFTHFMLNATHFTLLTYPALK
ncbi:MAG: CPBP family intramembrane metalloprotease [Gammaproteobacteria bacterium]|nr:CPBP family intramembrane metalloprotease [Gammaproteobacteria bacterium]